MTDAPRHGAAHREPRPAPPATAYDRASDAARKAVEGIDANPLGILVGGLAVGVLAGALIPRSAKEKELLAPVGQRLHATARAAADAAKEVAKSELQNRGLTADAGRDQVRSLLAGVGQALATAGSAAAKAGVGAAKG